MNDLPGYEVVAVHGEVFGLVVRARNGNVERKVSPVDLLDDASRLFIDSWESTVSFTKSMPGGFRTERIWHGLLAENATQALCAALLRDCLVRVEYALRKAQLDARIVGHTHDEILLESLGPHAALAQKILLREMERVPEWLPGFPLASDVKTGIRYVK